MDAPPLQPGIFCTALHCQDASRCRRHNAGNPGERLHGPARDFSGARQCSAFWTVDARLLRARRAAGETV